MVTCEIKQNFWNTTSWFTQTNALLASTAAIHITVFSCKVIAYALQQENTTTTSNVFLEPRLNSTTETLVVLTGTRTCKLNLQLLERRSIIASMTTQFTSARPTDGKQQHGLTHNTLSFGYLLGSGPHLRVNRVKHGVRNFLFPRRYPVTTTAIRYT